MLVRVIDVLDGEVPLDIDFAPRAEYGLVFPRLEIVEGGVAARGGATALFLSGLRPTGTREDAVRWRIGARAGDRLAFALQWTDPTEPKPEPWSARTIEDRLAGTVAAWESWSALHQRYDGPWAEAVQHSGRVLQGLARPGPPDPAPRRCPVGGRFTVGWPPSSTLSAAPPSRDVDEDLAALGQAIYQAMGGAWAGVGIDKLADVWTGAGGDGSATS